MKAYTLRGRILATFLSAAVLTNLFIKAPVKAAAEVLTGGTTRAGATELFEGKQDIYTAGETGTGGQTLFNTWYKFTPTVSGNFVIKAYSSAAEGSDTEASIYSANYILNYDYSTDPVQQTPEYEASRSDLGDGYIAVDNGAVNYGGTNPNDFGFSINLTAGTTYLMFIGNYGIDHALTTLYINGPVNSLKSTGAAQDSISLGWTIPEDIGNSNSISIMSKLHSDTTWTEAKSGIAKTDNSATISGLTPNTSYDFKLVVAGGENAGDSNIVTETTAAIKHNITYNLDGGVNNSNNPDKFAEGVGTALSDPQKTGYKFDGWYIGPDFTNKISSIPADCTTDVTLCAKWIKETYTITYNLDNGTNSDANPLSYQYGDSVTFSNPLDRTGYTFGGWYTDSGFTNSITSILPTDTGNKTLFAKWTANNYNITYNLGGGTNSTNNADSYTYGVGMSLSDPTRNGYKFNGWYTDSNFTNSITSISPTDTGDKTLFAKWTANSYNITYNLGGGTNSTKNADSYTYGVGMTLSDPTRNGYEFTGWYSDENLTQKVTAISAVESGDKVLYAGWTPCTYTITYNMNGGTNSGSNPSSYTYGTGLVLSNPLDRTGYTFGGWYTDSNFTNSITSILPTDTGDKTLFAKWTANSYKITYNLGGGTNSIENADSYTFGIGMTLSDPARNGYEFTGWYSDSALQNKVTSISAVESGDKVLYAGWTPCTYTITYNMNGGTNSGSNPFSYTYGTGLVLSNPLDRTGYTFGGWYTDSNFTNSITSISPTDTGDKTLFAEWTANSYNITYNLGGGTNSTKNADSYTYGVGMSLSDPTRNGYEFTGWYSDENLTQKVTAISAVESGDKVIYAGWTLCTYTITYNMNGGTNSGSNPSSYKYGDSVTLSNPLDRTGYTFGGWYTDSNFTNSITSISPTDTGDKTLFVKWTANSYNITYNLGGGTNSTKNADSYTYGIGMTLSDPARNGYEFTGWYSDENLTQKVTAISAVESGDKVLYAGWTPCTYTITYNMNGGTNSGSNPSSYKYGDSVTLNNPLDRTGYTFGGWYTDSNFTNSITSISPTDTGDKTLFVKWTANSYNITYNLGGGTNSTKNADSYTYGIGMTLSDPTRNGYEFTGWYSDSALQNKVTSISAVESGDKVLYAGWTLCTYTITYNMNGGTNSGSNPSSYKYGDSVTLSNPLDRTGYTFGGWYTDSNFTNSITSISPTDTGDKTLFAKWTANSYKITYKNMDGCTNSTNNADSYTYGIGMTLSVPLDRTDYTFTGWYLDIALTQKVTSISAVESGDKVLYAGWKQSQTPNNSSTGTITGKYEQDIAKYAAEIHSGDLNDQNLDIILDDVKVTADDSLLKNILVDSGSSYLKLTQAPIEDKTVSNAVSEISGGEVLSSIDVGLLKIYSDGTQTSVHQLGGYVTVTISLNTELSANSDYKLYYYDPQNKTLTDMNAVFDQKAGTVTFKTNHFSTFVVVKKDAAAIPADKISNPKTGVPFLPFDLVTLGTAASIISLKKLKKRSAK